MNIRHISVRKDHWIDWDTGTINFKTHPTKEQWDNFFKEFGKYTQDRKGALIL